MGGCVSWLLLGALAVFVMVSLIRWFEQTTDAVDTGWWGKVFVLVAMPFTVWFFPSKVSAGRPTPVPRHEPVRGFGKVPLAPRETPAAPVPPPGTPKEFLGKPVVPPLAKRAAKKSSVDPVQAAKLKQKMREQGMLGDE